MTMSDELYKEKTLPSGEQIVLSLDEQHSLKPYNVTNWLGDECRWSVNFATVDEAQREYDRWN